MREILKWEISKIWRRKSTKVLLVIGIAYMIFSAIYNAVVNLGTLTGTYGNNCDGITEISRQYGYADKFRGELTPEKLVYAYNNLKTAYSEKNLEMTVDGSMVPKQAVWDEYVVPLGTMSDVLRDLYNYVPEYSYFNSIINVEEDEVENFYGVRDEVVANYLSSQVVDEKNREYFLKQNESVTEPFYYDWYDGQGMYLQIMAPIPVIIALMIAVFAAPVYALEYQQKTDSLIMSAKNGQEKLAVTKLLATLIFSSGVYLLLMAIYVSGQLIFVGTRGLDCPIQLIKPIATAPMTIFEAELYEILLGYLSCMAILAVTSLLSSRMHTVFPVIVTSMAIIFVPTVMGGTLPDALSALTAVIPFMSDYTELFRNNMYFHIWSPYLMIVSPVVIALICAPLSLSGYKKHQVV